MLLENLQVGVVLVRMSEILTNTPSPSTALSRVSNGNQRNIAYELFATESTNRLWLSCFDWCAIWVDLGTSTCGIGFLLLAVDAVFLGDRHIGSVLEY